MDTIEITPTNVKKLFGKLAVPVNTNIIVQHSKNSPVMGKVTQSKVFTEFNRMIVKIDKSTQLFSYPRDRFFLPYITTSHREMKIKLAVGVTPLATVTCRT
jgi:hypothetical protein